MPRHKIFMKSKTLPKVRNAYTYKIFHDSKYSPCIMQESSCVEKSLWLGRSTETGDLEQCMHLNERQVKELIQDLQSWVENAI